MSALAGAGAGDREQLPVVDGRGCGWVQTDIYSGPFLKKRLRALQLTESANVEEAVYRQLQVSVGV
jgi:hypothetical protein